MAVPVTADLFPGLATVTVLVMVQLKVVVPDWLDGSVAVRVTEDVPGVVGVPVIDPVAELIDNPAGSPVADQVKDDTPDCESVAVLARAVMGEPVTLDWLPGLVTATVLVTVQVIAVVPK